MLKKLFCICIMLAVVIVIEPIKVNADFVCDDSGNIYYEDDTGKYVKGLKKINGYYYYFDKQTGIMVRDGAGKSGDNIYYFGEGGVYEGKANDGFYEIDGKLYVCDNGKVSKGRIWRNNDTGKCYYFGKDGELVKSKKRYRVTSSDSYGVLYKHIITSNSKGELTEHYYLDISIDELFTGSLRGKGTGRMDIYRSSFDTKVYIEGNYTVTKSGYTTIKIDCWQKDAYNRTSDVKRIVYNTNVVVGKKETFSCWIYECDDCISYYKNVELS